MTSPTPPKLPVFSIVAETMRVTYRNFGLLLSYFWPWLLMVLAMSSVAYWITYPASGQKVPYDQRGNLFTEFLVPLATMAVGAAIAVPWHRYLLLQETPAITQAVKHGGAVLKYLAVIVAAIVALGVIVGLVGGVLVAFEAGSYGDGNAELNTFSRKFWVESFIIWFLTSMLASRLSLVLPAVAVDAADKTVATAWSVTRGNSMRIATASILAVVPSMMLISGIQWVAGDPPELSRFGYTTTNIVTDFIYMTIGMTSVTFLSLAYRHFFGPIEGGGASVPSPRPSRGEG